MDNFTAFLLAQIAAGLLGLIITLVILYWVIRLAVTGALKAHTRWVRSEEP